MKNGYLKNLIHQELSNGETLRGNSPLIRATYCAMYDRLLRKGMSTLKAGLQAHNYTYNKSLGN